MTVRVRTGARLHFGFTNLSLTHERLYGGLGVAIDRPTVVLEADRAEGVDCDDPEVRPYAERVVSLLGVPGVSLSVERDLPRHAGLGSGTQTALATLTAVARAYGEPPLVRERAPDLGRGGRSGVGVATFEQGGFVLDAGHPTTRFTTDRPADGEWTVPRPALARPVPDDWRFLLIVPDVGPGRSGEHEDESMRSVVERADPELADRISGTVVRRLLPALAEGSARRFGEAVAELGRLNGAWYADEQGGVYRPPVGALVAALNGSTAVFGAGQSSWGPTVYGVTDVEHADEAREAGRRALDEIDVDGEVHVARGRETGSVVEGFGSDGDGPL